MMIRGTERIPLADPGRFRTIQDLTRLRPDCGASIDDILVIDRTPLLIVDITRTTGIMNPYNSPEASYVRMHGVTVGNRPKTEPCPVLWSDPTLLLPVSDHLESSFGVYQEIGEVVGWISCPSGAYLLLPARPDMPAQFNRIAAEALERKTGVKIKLPDGAYRVFYEQFEPPAGFKKELYQNIVVQRQ